MADQSYEPGVYREQGGNRMVVKSGAYLDVESGGEIDIEAGGAFKVAGVAVTPAIEVVTTTNVITAAESGKTFFLNSATGFVSTLPAKAAGLRFTFILGATQPTSGNHTVVCTNDDNTIQGEIVVAGATVPGVNEGSINFVASTTLPGDRVDLINDGTNWYVQGTASATGGITLTT